MKNTASDIAFGMEIETPWPVMLARVNNEAAELLNTSRSFYTLDTTAQQRVQRGFDMLDAEFKDRVDAVFGSDIVRGKDSYAEFALQPKRDPDELLATVQGLYDADILREGEVYPLQITLGNVPAGVLASYVLMATEICDGTTPERMAEVNTWSRRGVAGIWKRKSAELQFGMKTGVELRSLVLTGMQPLEKALKIAEKGGRMVVAKIAGHSEAREASRELGTLLKNHAAEKDINTTVQWWNPQQGSSPWAEYVRALQDDEWRTNLEEAIVLLLG